MSNRWGPPLSSRAPIHAALRLCGTESYVRARQCGHVLYVEGDTDIRILRALARRLGHRSADFLDARVNAYYTRDIFPAKTRESELLRAEDGFGKTPREHFAAMKGLLPELHGLAILDSDQKNSEDRVEGDLQTSFWRRYEIENYFVTPELLTNSSRSRLAEATLFRGFTEEIEEALDEVIQQRVFHDEADFEAWKSLHGEPARLLWEAATRDIKLSEFAEDFFRRLAARTGGPMLLRKGDLDRLVAFADPDRIPAEVTEKLDRIAELDDRSSPPRTLRLLRIRERGDSFGLRRAEQLPIHRNERRTPPDGGLQVGGIVETQTVPLHQPKDHIFVVARIRFRTQHPELLPRQRQPVGIHPIPAAGANQRVPDFVPEHRRNEHPTLNHETERSVGTGPDFQFAEERRHRAGSIEHRRTRHSRPSSMASLISAALIGFNRCLLRKRSMRRT